MCASTRSTKRNILHRPQSAKTADKATPPTTTAPATTNWIYINRHTHTHTQQRERTRAEARARAGTDTYKNSPAKRTFPTSKLFYSIWKSKSYIKLIYFQKRIIILIILYTSCALFHMCCCCCCWNSVSHSAAFFSLSWWKPRMDFESKKEGKKIRRNYFVFHPLMELFGNGVGILLVNPFFECRPFHPSDEKNIYVPLKCSMAH